MQEKVNVSKKIDELNNMQQVLLVLRWIWHNLIYNLCHHIPLQL